MEKTIMAARAKKNITYQRRWDMIKTIGEVVVLIAKFFLRK